MEMYNEENASPTIMNAFDLELEKGIEQGIELEKREIAKKLILKKCHWKQSRRLLNLL